MKAAPHSQGAHLIGRNNSNTAIRAAAIAVSDSTQNAESGGTASDRQHFRDIQGSSRLPKPMQPRAICHVRQRRPILRMRLLDQQAQVAVARRLLDVQAKLLPGLPLERRQ